jgi:TetR/AcrR family transcriptional regulator, repressor for neighboring sulfatase
MKTSPRTRVRSQAARGAETARPAARRSTAAAPEKGPRRRKGLAQPPGPRTRRSASEARERILEAAQRELLRVGPEALRLTDLARQLQVSHPAILHHFGSREGLVAAVVRHSMQALTQQLMAAFQVPSVQSIDRVELIELVARVCGDGGLARLLAFLLLQDRDRPSGSQLALKPLVDTAHELRQRYGHPASYEDTRFEIQLIAVVLLGDAIFGEAVRGSTGAREAGDALDFRRRLTLLLPR